MPIPSERNLSNFKVSESFWRLMQTDPIDDRTLIDGTGSLVTYLVVSGTLEAYYLKGDGSQITNLNIGALNVYSSSQQVVAALVGQDVVVNSLTAQQYIVSSSVYYTTQSFSSGSTIFGNSLDDIHQFTGSLFVFGGITGSMSASSITNFDYEVSKSVSANGFGAILPIGVVSSSTQVIHHVWYETPNIISGSGQLGILGLGPTDSVTFGNLYSTGGFFSGNVFVDGTLTARSYVVSSSVVNIQTLDVSGSTKFGDTVDDRHEYTGSVYILGDAYATSFSGTFIGAISSSAQLLAMGFITGSGSFNGTVEWDNILNKPVNLVSGSGQRFVLGLAESDSPTFANLYATNMDLLGNLVVAGTITARTYVVSSSIVNIQTMDVSGSTRFGDTTDDRHEFTGSVYVSGSLIVPYKNTLEVMTDTGSFAISGSDLYIYI